MKFLCVPCDEQMSLKHAVGPDGGSVALVYSCPTCASEMAMLTNAHETQVVASLGVRIGSADDPEAQAAASKCPFTGMLADMDVPVTGAERKSADNGRAAGIAWTDEARERMANIPDIVRASAVAGIEKYAVDHGYEEVDASVLERARTYFGMA